MSITIEYCEHLNTAYISILDDLFVSHSDQVNDNVIIDYNDENKIVGIEFIGVNIKHCTNDA